MPTFTHKGRRYVLGKHRGIVTQNKDTQSVGRLKVKVPSLWGDQEHHSWAEPNFPSPEFFYIPPVGSQVWIEFQEGDPDRPIWTGSILTGEQPHKLAKIGSPKNRSIKTERGLQLDLDDNEDEIRITIKGSTPQSATIVSDEGKLKIQAHEGFVPIPYRTLNGIDEDGNPVWDKWTIGYGQVINDPNSIDSGALLDVPNELGSTAGSQENFIWISEFKQWRYTGGFSITREDATVLFNNAIDDFTTGVLPLFNPLNQNELDGIVSLAYNVGAKSIENSRFRQRFNEGDLSQAEIEFKDFNRAGGVIVQGLVSRREEEWELITTPVDGEEPASNALKILMKKDSNKIIIEADNIELGEGAAESIVRGDTFQTLFNSHTHLISGISTGTDSVTSAIPLQPMVSGTHISDKHKVE